METRRLGTGGLEVAAMGLGCMSITHGYVRP
jgi:aryl-alcohol dehydrogenase-like predicted oxidoreductase